MKEYKEDIKFLIDKIEEIHPNPYLYYDKILFYKDLEELSNKNLRIDEFKYELIKCVSKLNDPHTNSLYKRSLFFEVKMIDNKVYVIHDYRNLNSKYLYKEIKRINDVDIQDIIPYIIEIIPTNNKEWQKAMIEFNLLSKEFLKSINIIKDEKYFIELEDGSIVDGNKEELKTAKCLITYFDQKEISKDTYYVKYSKCYSSVPNKIEEFLDEVIENIKIKSPKNIIIDLRDNTGGKSSYFTKFYNFLKEQKDINYFTLIDEYVFSSGRWALQEMLELNSIVIGTPAGAYKDVFGEVKRIFLPNSKIEFGCSSKYFKYEDSNFNEYTKENINMIIDYKEELFIPDYLVEQTIEDYKEGKDLVINKALELINNYSKGVKK